jgi:UDP-GlcNAc:undecaprenyl-phosphate/decaprenyl-phosphate GlcNAc-1-phosphate transferase
MSWTSYGIYFALAFCASVPLVFGVRWLARRYGLVAVPRADRWHRKPTALFGGVGIFLAFLAIMVWHPPEDFSGDQLLLACSAGMFALGLLDDFVRLKPYAKLIGQIIFSTALTLFGTRLHWLSSPVLDQALTIFWLVGIANAVNLLDNLDGLAGGVAVIASAYLVFFCHDSGQFAAAAMAAAFSGAVAGFLVFNVNPASIFMGDCGSLFIGFFLGGVTMMSNHPTGLRRNVLAVLAGPVLLLLIPIVDTTLVTIMRKLNGRPVSQGGRDHTSHRLVAIGLSERKAAFVLWGLSALSGAIAVAVRVLALPVTVLLVPVFGLAFLGFFIFLGRVKVYQKVDSPAEGQGRALLPTLADFAYKRRIFEVLHDLALIVMAYYGAFLLRFDGQLVEPFYTQFQASMPLLVVVQISAFLALGLYRGLWRYTSTSDLVTLVRAVGGAWVGTIIAFSFLFRMDGFSRGVLIMDGILLGLGIATSRLSFRMIRDYVDRLRNRRDARRVLIYGAGDGGELLVRALLSDFQMGLRPVGFIDDDPQKRGRVIHGLRVLGPFEMLTARSGDTEVDEIVISTDKIPAERTAQLARLTEITGIRTRRMRIALD